jgi:hypothetical protein
MSHFTAQGFTSAPLAHVIAIASYAMGGQSPDPVLCLTLSNDLQKDIRGHLSFYAGEVNPKIFWATKSKES